MKYTQTITQKKYTRKKYCIIYKKKNKNKKIRIGKQFPKTYLFRFKQKMNNITVKP